MCRFWIHSVKSLIALNTVTVINESKHYLFTFIEWRDFFITYTFTLMISAEVNQLVCTCNKLRNKIRRRDASPLTIRKEQNCKYSNYRSTGKEQSVDGKSVHLLVLNSIFVDCNERMIPYRCDTRWIIYALDPFIPFMDTFYYIFLYSHSKVMGFMRFDMVFLIRFTR
jgi:hypothetical protein